MRKHLFAERQHILVRESVFGVVVGQCNELDIPLDVSLGGINPVKAGLVWLGFSFRVLAHKLKTLASVGTCALLVFPKSFQIFWSKVKNADAPFLRLCHIVTEGTESVFPPKSIIAFFGTEFSWTRISKHVSAKETLRPGPSHTVIIAPFGTERPIDRVSLSSSNTWGSLDFGPTLLAQACATALPWNLVQPAVSHGSRSFQVTQKIVRSHTLIIPRKWTRTL